VTVRFSVLGDGAWGTAIAILLAQNADHHVSLWSRFEANARIIREKRENVFLLPGVPVPDSIQLTTDPTLAVSDVDFIVSAIPTVYLRETLALFHDCIAKRTPIVSLTKGIEMETFRRPSEIIRDVLGCERVMILSGPSHAEEVARGMPTSLVVAGEESQLLEEVQQRFTTDRFRIYTNPDAVGVELAGALKNVIGIAAGISDGLGFGDNAKSALLTRGLVEMIKFGVAYGARASTFTGLAGFGDLITTCISQHGRNRNLGEKLGRGETLCRILADSKKVVEGVGTSRSVHFRSQEFGLELPIMNGVYQVLFEEKPPLIAVRDLMLRPLSSEQIYFEEWPK